MVGGAPRSRTDRVHRAGPELLPIVSGLSAGGRDSSGKARRDPWILGRGRRKVGGGGGSWSARIVEFANDLHESKRPSSAIRQKALVQVQNRYSRWVLTANHPTSATGAT